jgi:hypothetical protein
MSGVRAKFDITGKRYGHWSVVGFDRREHRKGGTRLFWLCECDCGTRSVLDGGSLRDGNSTSCGCARRIEGVTFQPGYSSLEAALGRCHNPNNTAFSYYGARGISVCDRWRFGADGRTGPECFLDDMGHRPEGLSLDRIDTNGNYEPGNCRWATKKLQQQNQRRGIFAVIGGVRVPLKKYVARTGLCYQTIRGLVRRDDVSVGEAVRGYLARSGGRMG